MGTAASTDDPQAADAGPGGVAIVTPAWNAAATVGRAVRAALSQTGLAQAGLSQTGPTQSAPCQMILVDDASTDDTVAVAEAAAAALGPEAAARLTIIRQTRNAGPAAARNAGIEAAVGADWIALLDADDAMEPGRIAGLIAVAAETGADLVADDLYRVVEGALDGPRRRLVADADFTPHDLDFEAFVIGNLHGSRGHRGELGFLKPLMRKAFLDRHGLRYDPAVRLGEDYELYARALARGARMHVTNPLGYFAVERSESLSGDHGAADLAALAAADRRLLADPALGAKERRAVRRHLVPVRREAAWMRLIDAVKARAPGEALASFAGPPDVALTLLSRLGEQAWRRGARRLRSEDRSGDSSRGGA